MTPAVLSAPAALALAPAPAVAAAAASGGGGAAADAAGRVAGTALLPAAMAAPAVMSAACDAAAVHVLSADTSRSRPEDSTILAMSVFSVEAAAGTPAATSDAASSCIAASITCEEHTNTRDSTHPQLHWSG